MPITTPYKNVAIHTFQGVQLYQLLPTDQITLSWGREVHEVTRCELRVSSTVDFNVKDIVPWLHWVSVWDGDAKNLYWTGPIQKAVGDRNTIDISARDVAAYTARTRCPLTKKWDAADPGDIAAELWDSMIELQGLSVKPVVRPDPEGNRFDFEVKADEKMVEDYINDLVGLGLKWSVVAGTPVLGPSPVNPIAAFSENDFVGGGLTLVRDGATTFNDVLLRGADSFARKRVELGGLNLQTIVHIDNMFKVSNTDRATTQYVKHTGVIRDLVQVPGGAVLHPDAHVTVEELVPTARFVVEAFDLMTLVQLDSMEDSGATGESAVKVTMSSVVDLPELSKLTGQST